MKIRYFVISLFIIIPLYNQAYMSTRNVLMASEWKETMKHYYENIPVLVTGGAGFIGSHLVEALVNVGARVTVLDDLSTGKLEYLEKVRERVTFIRGSVADAEICLRATCNQKIVFHLAAYISVPGSVANPTLCHRSNVDGTFQLLEACRHNNVPRFVFSSSCSVYGNQEDRCSENTSTNPSSPYALSKLLGEHYCSLFHNTYGLRTICLRYFNVYGERQDPHGPYAGAMAAFTHRLQNNEPIVIHGDGQQTRDFVPVHEVVRANMTVATLEDEWLDGRAVNVASGRAISIFDLFTELRQSYPEYKYTPAFVDARAGDVRHVSADLTRLYTIYKMREILN